MSSIIEPPNPKRHADEALANTFTSNFVPKKKVTLTHGRTHLNVYPDITNDMGDHERSLAFNINKTAVQNAYSLNHFAKLSIMGEKHNCSNLIDVETAQWKTIGFNQLKNNSNLTLVSYHDRQGLAINECFDSAGLLKPIQDGALNACRPPNIYFAKVKGTMSFTTLSSTAQDATCTFFLRLPTNDYTQTNTAGVARTFITFNGVVDWFIQSQEDYTTTVYTHDEAIPTPFELQPADFTSTAAIIDLESKENAITASIIKSAYPILLDQIFKQSCPNFVDDPFDTLNKVHQRTTLSDGSIVTSPVRGYHDMVQIILTTFPRDATAQWAANPFRKFVEGLLPDIRDKMESNGFKKHIHSVSSAPHEQIKLIQEGFEAACIAESQLAKQRLYIHDQIKGVHGFIATPQMPPFPSGPAPTSFGLYSPAEQALIKYRDPAKKICWGCGAEDDHIYYDKTSKQIMCPQGNDPKIQAHAEAIRKDFVSRLKKRRSSVRGRNPNDKALRSMLSAILSPERKDKKGPIDASAFLLEYLKTQTNDRKSKSDATGTPSTFILLTYPVVLNATNKPQLPIPINNTLPHIILNLGTTESSFNPGMPCIVDTGAALCIAYSGYIMPICKAYPELVKSITLAKDRYSPIVLSGVVTHDGSKQTQNFTTNLPAVVELHLPYLTENGQPTSLKLAVGDDVSVNILLGMSFIQNAKLVIDTNDNVVESKILDTPPFPIHYRPPMRSAPSILPPDQATENTTLLANYSTIIDNIKTAEAFISNFKPGSQSNNITTSDPETIPTFNHDGPNHKTKVTFDDDDQNTVTVSNRAPLGTFSSTGK
jgi:hypothetical protein